MRDLEHAMETNAKAMIILEKYLRIRQFSAHPSIYVDAMRRKYKKYGRESWTGTASKATAFRQMLADTPAEPTIVFTTFKMEAELVESALKDEGYRVWNIGGGMSDAARTAVTEESKSAVVAGETAVAIIVQISAGGAGLNLQQCSRIIFMSSHWNPAVVDQSIARAYRMGQTKPVKVVHMLLADDAEKNIDRLMNNKHGMKRKIAVEIHASLFCDSAVEASIIRAELDAAMGIVAPLEEEVAPEDE